MVGGALGGAPFFCFVFFKPSLKSSVFYPPVGVSKSFMSYVCSSNFCRNPWLYSVLYVRKTCCFCLYFFFLPPHKHGRVHRVLQTALNLSEAFSGALNCPRPLLKVLRILVRSVTSRPTSVGLSRAGRCKVSRPDFAEIQ